MLYGVGITNQAVIDYFNRNKINYDLYTDQMNTAINLSDYNLIIKTPGIKPTTNIIKEAKMLNIPVITDLELYYLLTKNCPIIGVTGSNGKTTVVTLINKILKTDYQFVMGGNIGIPLFSLIDLPKNGSIIECSSFELDGTKRFKPHIWIILNIEEHHLDYHQTYDNYFSCKTRCLDQMLPTDIVIYNYDNILLREYVRNFNIRQISFSRFNENANVYIKNNKIYYFDEEFLDLNNCQCRNCVINVDYMPVIIVGNLYNVKKEEIIRTLLEFKTLEHRCEIVVQDKSHIVINDSKSTSPTATLGAFEFVDSIYCNYKLKWIAGGKLTKDNYHVLSKTKNNNVEAFLFGENKEYLEKNLDSKLFNIRLFPNLESIIEYLYNSNLENTVILFSPASPSFDMYKSFEERGNIFKNLILKNEKKEQ